MAHRINILNDNIQKVIIIIVEIIYVFNLKSYNYLIFLLTIMVKLKLPIILYK